MNKKRVVFRVDSSLSIGSGHVMRCLTLAEAMRGLGWQVSFLSKPYDGNLNALIAESGYQCIELPLHSYHNDQMRCESLDAADSIQSINGFIDLLVIDHYALAKDFCQKLRVKAKYLMVIDDLATREYDCDFLLNQNLLPRMEKRYLNKVNENCILLLGTDYVLLRKEFYSTQKRILIPEKKILVFFGAADKYGLTLMALNAILNLKNTLLIVDVVINKTHPQKEIIAQLCSSLCHVNLHIQTMQMAQLMRDADLMVGAGGSTHWERAILGLPALVVTLAANQVETTSYLHQLGVCEWIGDVNDMTGEIMEQYLRDYLSSQSALINMRKKMENIIKGKGSGVDRTIKKIQAHLQS